MTILDFIIIVAKALFTAIFSLSMVPLLVWLERKISSLIQDRIGPNRASIGFVRLGGLIHLIADSIKMFFKEDIIPKNANKLYYHLAPFIVASVSLMTFATIPFADTLVIGEKSIPMQVLNIDAGLIWFFAIVSLSVYGIVFAGWASNSKFPLLGGLRASSQMLSYEIPMGLSIIGMLMIYGTPHLNEIVVQQGEMLWGILPKWGVVMQPVAAIIFIICAFAETNRTPFDLAEGESELVAGYHTEYSSMKFGLFFMAEYVSMVVSSALITTLFFGGWQVPFFSTQDLIENAKVLTVSSMGFFAILSFFIMQNLIAYNKVYKTRWKDIRDKEASIFAGITGLATVAFLAIGSAAMLFNLPVWYGPLFAFAAQTGTFLFKVFLFCLFFIWVRWTLPRFRYDQLMDLGWKSLLPLALANIFVTGSVMLAFL
jgi:NADH-quinone oxidoreductase subunit H